VSTTALEDKTKGVRDPRRAVSDDDEATKPMVVEAIYADIGPKNHLGEGSIALAEALGIPSDPKRGGTSRGVTETDELARKYA